MECVPVDYNPADWFRFGFDVKIPFGI
jgi:hypothetical protein